MTGSHHPGRGLRRGAALLAGLAALSWLGIPALAEHHEGKHAATGHGEADVVQVLSTNVQGKNVYIPSTIVVEAGRPTTLSIFNTTDVPHGFTIEGLGLEFILPSQEEFEVQVPALEGGKIYKIRCQLHPPHRTALLVVLDEEEDDDD